MSDRASIVRFLRREARERYAHAPEIAEAGERWADLVERLEDRVAAEPTIPFDHWKQEPSVGH